MRSTAVRPAQNEGPPPGEGEISRTSLTIPILGSPADYLSDTVQFGETRQMAIVLHTSRIISQFKMCMHYGEGAHAHSPLAGHPAGVLRLLLCFGPLSEGRLPRAPRRKN